MGNTTEKALEKASTAIDVSADLEAFDLGALDTRETSEAGARIDILHPINKEPTGIFIVVKGRHSQTFRDIIKDRADKRIQADASARERGKPTAIRTAEDIERDTIELFAACTIEWGTDIKDAKGEVVKTVSYINLKGEKLECNVPNAIRLYTEMLWLREQLDDGIGDLENFIKA